MNKPSNGKEPRANRDGVEQWSDHAHDSTVSRREDTGDSILRFKKPPSFNPSIRQRQYLAEGNPRLSILNLMAITAICAVTITLITAVGLAGVYVLLIICVGTNVGMASQLTDQPVQFRFWNQFTWGVLMPLVCIFGDPFVFGQFELGKVVALRDYGLGCYAFIGWQILFLAFSWVVPKQNTWQNQFIAGTLVAGGGFALAVALCMLPLTLLASLLLGLGAPGFVPWITGIVFIRTASMHLRRAQSDARHFRVLVALAGFMLAIAVGLGAWLFAAIFDLGFDSSIDEFF